MTKALWSHFKHFGKLPGKIYLYLTPSKTDERVPSQQGAPTICNLTYWEVFQQAYVQTLLASLGVVTGQNWPLQLAGTWRERFLTVAHNSYSRLSNPLRHHELSISKQHFPSEDLLFFPNLPASKNFPEEQIFWATDPLGAPVCSQETSRHPRANNTIFHNFLAVPAEQHWVERRVHIWHSKYV